MEKFLNGEEPTIDELKKALRNATISGDINPVLCGTSYRNKGVQMLLDAIVEFLPSPAGHSSGNRHQQGYRRGGDPRGLRRRALLRTGVQDYGRPVRWQVWLLCASIPASWPRGSYVYNSTKGKRERVSRIMRMHANHRDEQDNDLRRRHRRYSWLPATPPPATPCATRMHPIILESMEFPDPVIRVAIEPKTKAGQEKMGLALQQAGRRRSHLQDLHRRADRPDHHRRYGRAASGDHR